MTNRKKTNKSGELYRHHTFDADKTAVFMAQNDKILKKYEIVY